MIFLWCKTSDSRPSEIWYYGQELNDFKENYEFLEVLENENVKIIQETYSVTKYVDDHYIRCFNKKGNVFFTIYGNEHVISKIWTIFQKEFNYKFSYYSLLFWFSETELFNRVDIKIRQEIYDYTQLL